MDAQQDGKGREALRASEGRWGLERIALFIQEVLLCFCPFSWFIDWPEERQRKKLIGPVPSKWDTGRVVYVIAWLIVLAGLWLLNPAQAWIRSVIGVLAGFRLMEIFVTGLGTALGQEAQARARNLITIAIYGIQLTLIFAILFHSFATADFRASGSAVGAPHSSSAYLYISWTSITSLGNESFSPTTDTARFLEVSTTTAGIFLLGVLLAFGIGEVQERNKDHGA